MAFGAVQITVADDDWVGCQVIDTDEIDCWADIELGFLKFDFDLLLELVPEKLAIDIALSLDGVELEAWEFSMESQPELCVDGFCVELTDVLITPDGFQACIELTLEEGIVKVPLGCYSTF
eukprot:gnl/Ergobibamus_cyprinoides/884.p2 GENE.gnl/Ergobibamus_cyprinoides/884~~gnl/Ergobibamus_cyprinoides/884.p2  ORF type:complete len:139 (+),score=73.72 gnl/Ergobibamus_cyprinoides/884:55-417(+)